MLYVISRPPAKFAPKVLLLTTVRITNFILTGYNLAIEIYCKNPPRPISSANVEKTVLSVVFACYDSASNGNRTRGELRKASEM